MGARQELRKECCERLRRELRAVKRGCGQSSERRRKRIPRDALRFCERAPGNLLGEKGSTGNRGRTAATKKTGLEDASIFDARRKLENVPTDGVADLDASCRVGEVTGIARITEVIEDGFVEHFQEYLSSLFELGMRRPKAITFYDSRSIRITD